MIKINAIKALSLLGVSTLSGLAPAAQPDPNAPPPPMGFFITSRGIGDGGNLGGLAGADAHCQALATEAGAGNRTWHAYLSTQGRNAVNARDRIGSGPWYNAEGLLMANNLQSLEYDNSNFNYDHILDEHGKHFDSRIDGDYDTTQHDVLTGTRIDGTAYPAGEDHTCNNWTSNDEGSATVGHADRYSFAAPGAPWNSSHGTPGCTPQALIQVGGAGLLYCFAIDSAD
ncbi:MAG: DUF1554 domain-containing protein [Pseudomonadales bacterium]|nr:DUF1554 domain-containing protein [Pseudomonadales bacterium]